MRDPFYRVSSPVLADLGSWSTDDLDEAVAAAQATWETFEERFGVDNPYPNPGVEVVDLRSRKVVWSSER